MPAAPAFDSSVAPVDAADLPASWRPGCPVPPEELRRVTIRHWGFDDAVHQGELVVHVDAVDAIEGVFRSLFDARFPLERVELVDRYDGDDDRSMAANNTSAFNCREIAGRPGVWSEHAYGRAVDLNPVQNPNVSSSGRVEPPAGTAFTDRDPAAPGLIRADGPAVTGFDAVGWSWGGNWSSSKDYQHFSATGR
ncbi:M15 family metallopeptidase [soil metagenome]